MGGDQELLREVLCELQKQLPEMRAQLETAFNASDRTQLRATAHGIRGTAGSVAAEAARLAAERVEEQACTPSAPTTLELLVGDLQYELTKLEQWLARFS
jgi:HPt (histidine-containing phosphotransfer) domain-containing protein